jgi:UDP-N-acetylmuramoyl-tripeptide--D-alanyl-D-alanine ligase
MKSDFYKLFKECGYRISTDTRKPHEGSLFLCLKGENFDANEFAQEALQLGCRYVISSDRSVCDGIHIFYAEDTLLALQSLANEHRKKMSCHIHAIGGSNGKTTTKELTYAVLSKQKNVLATEGNLNNHIGVPLTLLRIRPDTEIAVVEMGTNHPGEMEVLCNIAEPDSGIVTNIGKEHLEGFGSLEGVAKEESELYRFLLRHHGVAFVNDADEHLMRMASRLNNVVYFGGNHHASVCSAAIESLVPGIRFMLHAAGKAVHAASELAGAHNLQNMLAAAAAGIYFGIDIQHIAAALSSYQPANNRSQWLNRHGRLIWLDAYNANPSSMEAALRSFAAWDRPDKVVMLGDMFELGEHSREEHMTIRNLAMDLGFDGVFLCGPEFSTLRGHYAGKEIPGFSDNTVLGEWLRQNPLPSETAVLIKGSRGVAMEKVVENL